MENESENKETFESAYKKLEAIVNKMETESLDLETALKAFEDGRKAVDQCRDNNWRRTNNPSGTA